MSFRSPASTVLAWLLFLARAPFLPSRPHRLARDLRALLSGQLARPRFAAAPPHLTNVHIELIYLAVSIVKDRAGAYSRRRRAPARVEPLDQVDLADSPPRARP